MERTSRRMQQQQQKQQMPLIDQFKQQMLKAWQPVPSLTKTIIMFFILSLIFLGLGIPMIILSSNIQQYSIRYDNVCSITSASYCNLTLNIPSDMIGPIFVYYQLDGYYQNHRLYAKSISYKQLKGNIITVDQATTDCQPIVYNKQLYTKVSITGAQLDPNGVANPCGIIAYTVFNDSFTLKAVGTPNAQFINNSGIAWPSDFKKFVVTDNSTMWIDVSSQRFMNWMRIASMPTFRKLWGRIQNNIYKGNYTVSILNQYDTSNLGAKKYFVLTQSNFFGSKNDFLSITYIVVGGICLLIAIAFLIKKLMKKSKVE